MPNNKDENTVIHQGNLIALHNERVEFPNGGHTYFDIVKHPGGAVILAINHKQEVCLLKQWRHAVRQDIWELPAGCLEEGEAPLLTAQRELEEEAGVVASDWQALGHICSSPGFSNEILYLFCARELSSGVVNLDDAEQIEAHWVAVDEVKAMIERGEIIDAKTLALLYKSGLL